MDLNCNILNKNCTSELKGIAILLVISNHIGLIREGAWGVSLFLILSGFGLTLSYYKNGLDGYLKKRVSKVLIPYTILTFIWILLDFILFKKTYGVVKSVLCILGLGFKSPVDSSMWYITYLLIWYIVFYVIFKFVKKPNIRVLGMIIISVICYISIIIVLPNTRVIRNYSLCFPVGVILAEFLEKIKNIDKKYYIIFSIINFLLFYMFFIVIKFSKYQVNLISVTCFGLGFIFLMSYIYSFKISNIKLLDFVGKISYEMYLLEGVLLWKYKFLYELTSNDILNKIIYFIILIIMSLILNICMNKLFNFKAKEKQNYLYLDKN